MLGGWDEEHTKVMVEGGGPVWVRIGICFHVVFLAIHVLFFPNKIVYTYTRLAHPSFKHVYNYTLWYTRASFLFILTHVGIPELHKCLHLHNVTHPSFKHVYTYKDLHM